MVGSCASIGVHNSHSWSARSSSNFQVVHHLGDVHEGVIHTLTSEASLEVLCEVFHVLGEVGVGIRAHSEVSLRQGDIDIISSSLVVTVGVLGKVALDHSIHFIRECSPIGVGRTIIQLGLSISNQKIGPTAATFVVVVVGGLSRNALSNTNLSCSSKLSILSVHVHHQAGLVGSHVISHIGDVNRIESLECRNTLS